MNGQSRAAWLEAAAATTTALGIPLPAGAQALTKVRLGIGLIEAHAQGYYAQDMGYFRRAGLDVELRQFQLGAIVAEGVAAGELDFGQANLFSLLAGHQHGIPFVMLAPASLIDLADPPHDLLVVARDSPIQSVRELNGKTLGLLSIGGAQSLYCSAFVDKNGGNSSTLKFVQISPSAMVNALEQGRVSAVELSDPELTVQYDRIKPLGNTFTAVAPRFLEGAWFTTTGFLEKNKDTARRFAGAIVAAGRWSMDNPEAAAAILRKYLNVKTDRARLRFGTVVTPPLVQPICDLAFRYKVLKPMNAADVIWNGK